MLRQKSCSWFEIYIHILNLHKAKSQQLRTIPFSICALKNISVFLCQTAVMLVRTPAPFFIWKTAVSETFFNILFGEVNKAETCQVLDTSNLGKSNASSTVFTKRGVCEVKDCVCLNGCFSMAHTLTLFFFYLMMREESVFALRTPDSPDLPPQWNDCSKIKKEQSKR